MRIHRPDSRVRTSILAALGALVLALSVVPASAQGRMRDGDHDGLTNRFERLRSHTSPRRVDTDRDRLRDGFEVRRSHTRPQRWDTDTDGLNDGTELRRWGTNPRREDTDRDGTPDGVETLLGTNPRKKNGGGGRDRTPPDTVMTSAPTGTVATPNVTFQFMATEAGSSFQCRLDSGVWVPCASPEAYLAVADGAHAFDVRATDPTGNTDPTPATDAFTVEVATPAPLPPADTTPPDTAITAGPSGTVSSTGASFAFSASETGSSFECRLDGSAWAPCGPPKAYSSLVAGSHSFEVRATDVAGNTDPTPATRAWTISPPPPPADTTPPDTSITSGPSGIVPSGSASLSFSSTETGSTFECRLDGGAWETCASPKAYSGLADGGHTFSVRATDGAGNTDATPAARTWTVQTPAAPTASFTWSPQSPQGPPVTVTFTSTGSCPATPCSYEWRHGPPSNEPIGTGQTSSWMFQSTGVKTVVLRVTDSLGRASEATNTITVSAATPPPPPPPRCSNSIDDDGDGKIDYPADPGCSSTQDDDETDVVQQPPSTGDQFPNRATTGTPAGWTPTTTRSTDMDVTTAGTVIQDVRFTGGASLIVRAPNVTVRRVEFQGGTISNQVGTTCPGPGLLVEDTSFVPPAGQAFQASDWPAIESGSYTARRVEIVNRGEGFRGSMCGPVRVEDSFAFIHSSTTAAGCSGDLHSDGYQSYGAKGGTFNNVTFIFPINCGSAPYYAGYGKGGSSCAGLPDSSCPAQSTMNSGTYNINHMLVAGAGYAFRQQTPGTVTGLKIVNNAWAFGPIDNRCSVLSTWDAQIVTLEQDYHNPDSNFRVASTVRNQPCNTEIVE